MSVLRAMPIYQCHKKVWALRIKEVKQSPAEEANDCGGTWKIVPEESGYAEITVSHDFILKHQPQAGGYYVVYDDGYKSYSPAKAFEGGYTPVIACNQQSQGAISVGVLNTGQPAIKGYRNLTQAEVDLMNDIKSAGEQLRDLVNRVQHHINSQPAPEVPHSQVTAPGRWAAIGQTDLQTGLMALTRAVAQPTSF